jgi:hypothetical protein
LTATSKPRLCTSIVFICSMAVLAQNDILKTSPTSSSFLVDQSLPYVYLDVDHIGPGAPNRDSEPPVRIFLRLHNNSTVPIIVNTFGRPPESEHDNCGVFDDVVTNPPQHGDGAASYGVPPMKSELDLPSMLGIVATPPEKPSSKPSVESKVLDAMPYGYNFEVSSFATLGPGQSIYFSLPRNHVSAKWHVEIPFRFDLRVRTPVRSAHNFIALYEDDLAGKMPHTVQY